MSSARKSDSLAEEIVHTLIRRHSIATVLFHQAVAERLGLAATELKCLDLLRQRGALTGSDLAAITGLTSGAITGVVARLERSGYLRREADPRDGRQQILHPVLESMRDIHRVFEPMRHDVITLLDSFDRHQLTAIAEFLTGTTDVIDRHMALFRAHSLHTSTRAARTGEANERGSTRARRAGSQKSRRKPRQHPS
jgi:DNA-binding MarR family transcriptional regulator